MALTMAPKRLSWGWIGIAAISLFFLTLFLLPAKWVTGLVDDATACRVVVTQASGTIWHGSAAFGFAEQPLAKGAREDCQTPIAVTERFVWHTQCELSAMRCMSTITYPALEKPLQIVWRTSGVTIRANQVLLPANILEAFGNPWKTLRPRGQLTARWTDLALGDSPSGMIRIIITNMASPISAITPLGSYEIQGSVAASASPWSLQTTQGPLLLKGNGQWSSAGLQFSGEANAAPEAADALQGLLALLGRKEGGTYRLQF